MPLWLGSRFSALFAVDFLHLFAVDFRSVCVCGRFLHSSAALGALAPYAAMTIRNAAAAK
jgi:hypothetical protein